MVRLISNELGPLFENHADSWLRVTFPYPDMPRNSDEELESRGKYEITSSAVNEKRLTEYIAIWSKNLDLLQDDLNYLKDCKNKIQDKGDLQGLEALSDEELISEIHKMGFLAETDLDWIERFEIRILDLAQCRNFVWSNEAEILLERFKEYRDLTRWREQMLRYFIEQYCDEYARRYPDSIKLPFEPVNLGPTNAARLPPVL